MIKTFASEACSIEIWISSYMCHLPITPLTEHGLTALAHARLEPFPPGRRGQFRETLQRIACFPRDTIGHLHVDRDDQIPGWSVLASHALAPGPQLAPARRAGRHPHGDRGVQRGHPQVGAEHRLGDADRQGQCEVVPAAPEDLVRPHADLHIQVAGRAAAVAGLAPAAEPDPLPVGHARREADVDRAGLGDPTGAAALRALLVDDRPGALALAARLGKAERALVPRDQAAAVALRAGPRRGAGLGPAAVAGVALAGRPQRQRQRRAAYRLGEVEGHLGLHVPPAARAAPGGAAARTPAREDRAENVREARPAEAPVTRAAGRARVGEPAEQVGRVELLTAGAGPAAERARAEQRAHLVVL